MAPWAAFAITVVLAAGAAVSACSSVRADCGGAAPDGPLTVVCGFARPEDVQLVPSRDLLLVSEMGLGAPDSGGALSAVTLSRSVPQRRRLWPLSESESPAPVASSGAGPIDPACPRPPDADHFSGHGLTVATDAAGGVRVAVVGHGRREAIELFDLVGRGDDAQLEWRGCLPLPADTAGNDVVFTPTGGLLVTNYLPTVHGIRALLAMRRAARGEPTGDVLEWHSTRGWRHVPSTAASLPNGLGLSPDGRYLFVAENQKRRVLRYEIGSTAPANQPVPFDLPGGPDNISWSQRGTLLIAVLDPPRDRFPDCTPIFTSQCLVPWRILDLDVGTGAVSEVVAHDGRLLRSVTSVADGGDRLYLGSMADDRIGIVALDHH